MSAAANGSGAVGAVGGGAVGGAASGGAVGGAASGGAVVRVFIKTFGCRTNIYDSELIEQILRNAGGVGSAAGETPTPSENLLFSQKPAPGESPFCNGEATLEEISPNASADVLEYVKRAPERSEGNLAKFTRESEPPRLSETPARFEITSDLATADVIIINGCTVTNSADATTAAFIAKARAAAPGARVVLSGCAAAATGRKLFDAGKIDGVLGMGAKDLAPKLLAAPGRFFAPGGKKFTESTPLLAQNHHTKAFLKIQEGCDFNCSYCIIPAVRGRSRSVPLDALLTQARELLANSAGELVLTGTNMGSYGKEWGLSLGALLQRLGALPGLRRLRLGSLESAQIDEAFLELIGEPWLERHLHIALQHTHDAMLALMRRRNTALGDLALFERLAAAGYALGSDFIVGHPGESEAIWREAVQNLRRYPLTHLHAFVYSKRAGTHSVALARDLGEVPVGTARARLREISELAAANNLAMRQRLAAEGASLRVLIEQRKDGAWVGYDQFYNQLRLVASGGSIALASGMWVQTERWEAAAGGNVASEWQPL